MIKIRNIKIKNNGILSGDAYDTTGNYITTGFYDKKSKKLVNINPRINYGKQVVYVPHMVTAFNRISNRTTIPEEEIVMWN